MNFNYSAYSSATLQMNFGFLGHGYSSGKTGGTNHLKSNWTLVNFNIVPTLQLLFRSTFNFLDVDTLQINYKMDGRVESSEE
jgi:hypothetical protein